MPQKSREQLRKARRLQVLQRRTLALSREGREPPLALRAELEGLMKELDAGVEIDLREATTIQEEKAQVMAETLGSILLEKDLARLADSLD